MGYEDGFYKKENIIGYPGDLQGTPSVYFADSGGTTPRLIHVGGVDQVLVKFGHITQAHSQASNVGRGAVMESYSYSIYNNSEGFAEECVYGPQEAEKLFGAQGREEMESYGAEGVTKDGHYIFHPSRNRFIPVNKGTIDILALSIARFTKVKPCEA